MKYTTAVLSLAALAIAAPSEIKRTDEACNNKPVIACCPAGLLGGILCNVLAIGNTCSGQSYCCDNGSSVGGLVNVNALNCVKVL
ncbi:uncharacterized protein MAM_07377 [Metarhizium album ARSEF 1941]|uniref:Hydrophobin n=1 Tax=Metarhizium album (strain ARSEF 1941) TaxID=1081103 RepID=A0A0B2WFS3_METAS|nr:uncharacterized protein MAM_07377 [Metarhizium album ARSEF 1941]KHN94781.1 hypothetical protein MAM_07377 [Metarhizium album ARSEF 1941]